MFNMYIVKIDHVKLIKTVDDPTKLIRKLIVFCWILVKHLMLPATEIFH